ncbi:NTP transferase domain-containing protein [Actibacterium lipolyticum]|uniref:Purine catabolism protein PucB n=1 Tax=Actibacterium lipolyticum TaxID=1524263 RepID=A0A238JVC0_9RHOB|nr:molybdopterin-binding/glycosyltransferase family 2 protein [Actibacterium lipolyticum]SMX34545.1 Purine catabolism protein PucB [Actibacterium lipolyticum]
MKFGPVAIAEAAGCVLAHSLHLEGRSLRKGQVLSAEDVVAIAEAGINDITVARIAEDDLDENTAASKIADALVADGLTATSPFTGRVNLTASHAGLFRVDVAAVHALNRVDEAITLATLADNSRVDEGALLATIKVIPYAVPERAVSDALGAITSVVFRLLPNAVKTADLVLTETPGMKPTLNRKAETVTRARLTSLGVSLDAVHVVAHDERSVVRALKASKSDIVLLLGASATSDRADVMPAALVDAGGALHRFGMPVDPGNLLFTGALVGRPVVGLPGCARSPALNGADWVLERLVAGQAVDDEDIAQMGVGGLLKEIPQRKQPRTARATRVKKVELIMLAAGSSSRMRGEDKLLRHVDGVPLVRRSAEVALGAKVSAVHVVLPEGNADRLGALDGLAVNTVQATDWQEGMAASLRAGMKAISDDAAAVIVALADMPEVTAEHINRLIAAFDPAEDREICRSETADGTPGHPVLFSRRFFENLSDLTGDRGAKDILKQSSELVTSVPTPGQGAVVDLDTPEAWREWELAKG